MKQNIFSILFLVRKVRLLKSEKSCIHIRITINGRFVELNAQRKIQPSSWNHQKEKVIGKSPTSQEINRYLDGLRTKVYEMHRQLTDKSSYVEPILIKEHLLDKHQDSKLFFKVFAEHIEEMERLKGIGYYDITIRRYKLCICYFKKCMHRRVPYSEIL